MSRLDPSQGIRQDQSANKDRRLTTWPSATDPRTRGFLSSRGDYSPPPHLVAHRHAGPHLVFFGTRPDMWGPMQPIRMRLGGRHPSWTAGPLATVDQGHPASAHRRRLRSWPTGVCSSSDCLESGAPAGCDLKIPGSLAFVWLPCCDFYDAALLRERESVTLPCSSLRVPPTRLLLSSGPSCQSELGREPEGLLGRE